MADSKNKTGHPLDRQNALEREIQLEGSKDPEKYKMPDGRTLAEVQKENQKTQENEYIKERKMVDSRTREQSVAGLQKGESLVMTSTGNIIDTTEPKESETSITMAESRTSLEDIGKADKSRESVGKSETASTGETATSGGVSLRSLPAAPLSTGSTSPSK